MRFGWSSALRRSHSKASRSSAEVDRVTLTSLHPAMTIAFDRIAPVLPVQNVRTALDHYRRLGFEAHAYEEAGTDASDPVYGFLQRGAIELHLARVPDLDHKANTSACYLYVSDANDLFDEWSSAGVLGRLIPPVDTPYHLREFAHVDPDGNLLRIGSELRAA